VITIAVTQLRLLGPSSCVE